MDEGLMMNDEGMKDGGCSDTQFQEGYYKTVCARQEPPMA